MRRIRTCVPEKEPGVKNIIISHKKLSEKKEINKKHNFPQSSFSSA